MKLTKEEQQLRNEIAKERFIQGSIDPIGCFEAADKFIRAQREKHKQDEITDLKSYTVPPADTTGGYSPMGYYDGLPE